MSVGYINERLQKGLFTSIVSRLLGLLERIRQIMYVETKFVCGFKKKKKMIGEWWFET